MAKVSTPATASTVTHRRAAATRLSVIPVDELSPEDKPSKRKTPLSRLVGEEERAATRQSSSARSSKKNGKLKRKRGVSVESDESVPEIVAFRQDTPVERPAKKRRVRELYAESSAEEVESSGELRPQVNGSRSGLNKFDSEVEEDDWELRGEGKKRVRTDEEDEEEEEDPWDKATRFPSSSSKPRLEAPQGNKVIRIQRGVTKDKVWTFYLTLRCILVVTAKTGTRQASHFQRCNLTD